MKFITPLALFSFLLQSSLAQTVVTGQVLWDGKVLAGAKIENSSNLNVLSDIDGLFSIKVPGESIPDIRIIFFGCATLVISEILPNSDTLDLGKIPMVSNKSISENEYNRLDYRSRSKFNQVSHWGEVLGYYASDELEMDIDNCFLSDGASNYNSAKNEISTTYAALKGCN